MRNTQHNAHFLLVEKQNGIECIPSVLGYYQLQGFNIVHLIDVKHPTVRTLTDSGEPAKLDLVAKSRNKKTIIIVTPEIKLGRSSREGDRSMHENNQCVSVAKLADYENEIAKISDRTIGAVICYYSERSIKNLSFSDTIRLLKSHSGIIYSGRVCQPWDQQTFMHFLTSALDEMLGNGSAYLLMRTLHYVYRIAEDDIWRDPQILEEKIKRMFGRKSGEILDALSRRLREEISNNGHASNHERWAIPI
jgi:hypothetical protein